MTVAVAPTANPGAGTLSGTTTVKPAEASPRSPTCRSTSPASDIPSSRRARNKLGDLGLLHDLGSLQPCPPRRARHQRRRRQRPGPSRRPLRARNGSSGPGSAASATAAGPTSRSRMRSASPSSAPLVSPQPNAQFTASLEIDKSLVKSSGHPGASSWQICYAVPHTVPPSFKALPGTIRNCDDRWCHL